MALGTNYRRNQSSEDTAIEGRVRLAKQYASEFVREFGIGPAAALTLGTKVVLRERSLESIYEEYGAGK